MIRSNRTTHSLLSPKPRSKSRSARKAKLLLVKSRNLSPHSARLLLRKSPRKRRFASLAPRGHQRRVRPRSSSWAFSFSYSSSDLDACEPRTLSRSRSATLDLSNPGSPIVNCVYSSSSDSCDLSSEEEDVDVCDPSTTRESTDGHPVTPVSQTTVAEDPAKESAEDCDDHVQWMLSVVELLHNFLFVDDNAHVVDEDSSEALRQVLLNVAFGRYCPSGSGVLVPPHSMEETQVNPKGTASRGQTPQTGMDGRPTTQGRTPKLPLLDTSFEQAQDDVELGPSPTSIASTNMWHGTTDLQSLRRRHPSTPPPRATPVFNRVVLGAQTVHRLMRSVCLKSGNFLPPNESSGGPGDQAQPPAARFSPEAQLLRALYKRMPKLRRYFPYVLASTCAEFSPSFSSTRARRGSPTPIDVLENQYHPHQTGELVLLMCTMLKEEVFDSHHRSRTPENDPGHLDMNMEELSTLLHIIVQTIKTSDLQVVDPRTTMCISELMAVDPLFVTQSLLWKLLKLWPLKETRRIINYLHIIDTMLHICPANAVLGTPLYMRLFKRLTRESCSSQAQIAKRALDILGAPHILFQYVAPEPEARVFIQEALHENSKTHWSDKVREASEEIFDSLLDFA